MSCIALFSRLMAGLKILNLSTGARQIIYFTWYGRRVHLGHVTRNIDTITSNLPKAVEH